MADPALLLQPSGGNQSIVDDENAAQDPAEAQAILEVGCGHG